MDSWADSPGIDNAVHGAFSQEESSWSSILRAIVAHPDDPFRLRSAIRGDWSDSGTLPITCWMAGHKNGDQHASGYLITRDGAGYRCSACGVRLSVLRLGVERGCGASESAVRLNLLKFGIKTPRDSASKKGALPTSPGATIETAENGANDSTEYAVIDAVDLLQQPHEPPKFVVESLIPEQAVVLLTGDSGSAKTSWALHTSFAIAADELVACQFKVSSAGRPVLYINGEMGAATFQSYARSVAGAFEALQRGRLHFFGSDGFANTQFDGEDAKTYLEIWIDRNKPCLVVFDTAMGLFSFDENLKSEVRPIFSWLRKLAERGPAILILHHLRKFTKTSNSPRERVSGSRDFVNAVDVHLAALSREGSPMHAIQIAKVRTPGMRAGVCWHIKAIEEPGDTAIFTFDAVGQDEQPIGRSGQTVAEAKNEMLSLLTDGTPRSRHDLDANSGNRKRAFYDALSSGRIIECGV